MTIHRRARQHRKRFAFAVILFGVALLAIGCIDPNPADPDDASNDAVAPLDGASPPDVSTDPASGMADADAGESAPFDASSKDASMTDAAPADALDVDSSQSDASEGASSGLDADAYADSASEADAANNDVHDPDGADNGTIADSFSSDASIVDSTGRDAVDGAILDAADGAFVDTDSPIGDGDTDSPTAGGDASPDGIRPPIVITGRITEFTPPVEVSTRIIAGPDGALWMHARGGPTLVRLTPAGEFSERPVANLDGGVWGGFSWLIVGPDGHLWFLGWVEYGRSYVVRMTLQGEVTQFLLPTTVQAMDLAAGSDGNIWFSDGINHTVDRLTMDGQITAFQLLGSSASDVGAIISGPDQALWMTHSNDHKIGRLTTSGVYTEFVIPPPPFYPWPIAVGPDGNLWFNGYENHVGRINLAGEVKVFALHGGDPGSHWMGRGITGGLDGNVWATGEGYVSSISPDGHTIKEYPCERQDCFPAGVAAGSDHNIWYVDERLNVVGRVTP
jgi:streptogramin lyase